MENVGPKNPDGLSMSEMADRLRKARMRAGYHRASDAARAFGWSISTYLGHENGNRDISKKAALNYGRAFRVSAAFLLYGDESQGAAPPPTPAPPAPPSWPSGETSEAWLLTGEGNPAGADVSRTDPDPLPTAGLAANIKAHRNRLGMTLAMIGEHLGVTRQAVFQWEKGGASPSQDKIEAMATLFGTSLDALKYRGAFRVSPAFQLYGDLKAGPQPKTAPPAQSEAADDTSPMKEMGARLKGARWKAGYGTGSDAARKFGWPTSTYLGHENGSRGFTRKAALKYAEAFGVTVAFLLYGEAEGAPPSPAPERSHIAPSTQLNVASDETEAALDSYEALVQWAFEILGLSRNQASLRASVLRSIAREHPIPRGQRPNAALLERISDALKLLSE